MKYFILLLCYGFVACGSEEPVPVSENANAHSETATAIAPAGEAPVDTSFVRRIPLDLEGPFATVSYRLTAPSWHAPIAWEVNMVADGDTFYHRSGNSADLESDYELIVRRCDGNLGCKQKWFLELFPNVHIDTLGVATERRSLIDDEFFESIAETHFESMGYASTEAKEKAVELRQHYAGRPILVYAFPENPVVGGPLWAYDPMTKRLIPIYEG